MPPFPLTFTSSNAPRTPTVGRVSVPVRQVAPVDAESRIRSDQARVQSNLQTFDAIRSAGLAFADTGVAVGKAIETARQARQESQALAIGVSLNNTVRQRIAQATLDGVLDNSTTFDSVMANIFGEETQKALASADELGPFATAAVNEHILRLQRDVIPSERLKTMTREKDALNGLLYEMKADERKRLNLVAPFQRADSAAAFLANVEQLGRTVMSGKEWATFKAEFIRDVKFDRFRERAATDTLPFILDALDPTFTTENDVTEEDRMQFLNAGLNTLRAQQALESAIDDENADAEKERHEATARALNAEAIGLLEAPTGRQTKTDLIARISDANARGDLKDNDARAIANQVRSSMQNPVFTTLEAHDRARQVIDDVRGHPELVNDALVKIERLGDSRQMSPTDVIRNRDKVYAVQRENHYENDVQYKSVVSQIRAHAETATAGLIGGLDPTIRAEVVREMKIFSEQMISRLDRTMRSLTGTSGVLAEKDFASLDVFRKDALERLDAYAEDLQRAPEDRIGTKSFPSILSMSDTELERRLMEDDPEDDPAVYETLLDEYDRRRRFINSVIGGTNAAE